MTDVRSRLNNICSDGINNIKLPTEISDKFKKYLDDSDTSNNDKDLDKLLIYLENTKLYEKLCNDNELQNKILNNESDNINDINDINNILEEQVKLSLDKDNTENINKDTDKDNNNNNNINNNNDNKDKGNEEVDDNILTRNSTTLTKDTTINYSDKTEKQNKKDKEEKEEVKHKTLIGKENNELENKKIGKENDNTENDDNSNNIKDSLPEKNGKNRLYWGLLVCLIVLGPFGAIGGGVAFLVCPLQVGSMLFIPFYKELGNKDKDKDKPANDKGIKGNNINGDKGLKFANTDGDKGLKFANTDGDKGLKFTNIGDKNVKQLSSNDDIKKNLQGILGDKNTNLDNLQSMVYDPKKQTIIPLSESEDFKNNKDIIKNAMNNPSNFKLLKPEDYLEHCPEEKKDEMKNLIENMQKLKEGTADDKTINDIQNVLQDPDVKDMLDKIQQSNNIENINILNKEQLNEDHSVEHKDLNKDDNENKQENLKSFVGMIPNNNSNIKNFTINKNHNTEKNNNSRVH